ncbi:MAG: hypothetical protein ACT4TC_07270 [Myxococcaceae bacterium]
MNKLLLALALAVAVPSFADEDEVREIAERYLKSTTGEGDESGKELLLGGPSMDASLFSLENGKIVATDPVRSEKGDLGSAVKLMNELDKSAKVAIGKMGGDTGGDELQVTELTGAAATKIMRPTKTAAEKFLKKHPILGKALRVNKEVYWHPKNAMRPVMRKAGTHGFYSIVLHRFLVQSFEGPRKVPRKWGLKVVRFETDTLDTGWKVLPASDWSAE